MQQEVVNNWFDSFNRRDWTSIQQLYSDDAKISTTKHEYKGGKGEVELLTRIVLSFPDIAMTQLCSTLEGNNIHAVHWRGEGKVVGLPNNSAEKAALHGVAFFRIEHGQIVEHWGVMEPRYAPALK